MLKVLFYFAMVIWFVACNLQAFFPGGSIAWGFIDTILGIGAVFSVRYLMK